MKKIFKNLGLLFSGVLLICSLTACNNNTQNQTQEQEKPEVDLNNEVIKYYGSDNGHFNFRSEMKRCNDNNSELTEINYFFTVIEDLKFKNFKDNKFYSDLKSATMRSFAYNLGNLDISDKNCCDINNFYKEIYAKIPNAKIHVLIYNSSDYDENVDNKIYSPRIISPGHKITDLNYGFKNELTEEEQNGLFVFDKYSAFINKTLNLNNN